MKKLLILTLLVLIASMGFSALSEYGLSREVSGYTELVSPTQIHGTAVDDAMSGVISIGFPFNLDNANYSTFKANSNGFITLNEASTASFTNNFTAQTLIIGPLWDDLKTDDTNASVSYLLTGTAPNRILKVQYKNLKWYYNASPVNLVNFQIWLHETSNYVSFIYGSMGAAPGTSATASMGISGAVLGNYISVTPANPPTVSSAASFNSINATHIPFMTGYKYTFTPPDPSLVPNPANLVFPANGGTAFTNVTLQWSSGGGVNPGFRLYLGTDGGGTVPPTNLVNNLDLLTATSYQHPTSLAGSTTYYWQIVPYNVNGPAVNCPIWSFTTPTPMIGTYSIGPSGNFQTFTAAINALNVNGTGGDGVTFEVASGTYAETTPAITVVGSAAAPILFQAEREAVSNPVITPTGGTGSYGIKLDGARYVTFDGINVSASNLIYGYWLANGASNNTITNCTISPTYVSTTNYGIYSLGILGAANNNNAYVANTINNAYHGIYLTGNSTAGSEQTGVNVQGNAITGARNYAIYVGYAVNTDVQDNNIAFWNGGTTAYYGLYAVGTTSVINFDNNTINGGYTSSTVYGMYSATGNNTFTGNTVTNLYNTSSSGWYGCYATGTGSNTTWSGNSIYGILNTGTAAVYTTYITTGNHVFNDNQFYDIATGGTSLYGIYVIGGTTHYIYNNKIYNLRYTGSSSGVVYGIHLGSATTNVFNNMVYDLRNPGGSTAPQVRAFSVTSGTSHSIANNTVYLNSSGTNANYGTAAFYTTLATVNSIDLKNNIFVNMSTPGATGRAVAFWKSTVGFTNLTETSDRNIYYAGTPGPANLIGYFSTTPYETLADFKAYIAPRDAGSFTEDVPFVRTEDPYDLHIDPSTPTRVEGNALPITGLTFDIDNEARDASIPDIGADEGVFTQPGGAPGNVTLISPADGSLNMNPNQIVFNWSPPLTGGAATSYYIFVAESFDEFWDTQIGYDEVPATSTSYNLADMSDLDLVFGETYYWAIQAHNNDADSDIEDPSFMIWGFTLGNQMNASTTLDLGNVWPGAEATGTIEVQNWGNAPLQFDADGSAEFRFEALGRYTIPANSSVNLPYTFMAPEETGAYTGSIALTQTDPLPGTIVNISVTGNITSQVSFGDGSVNVFQPVYPYYGYTYAQTIYPASWFDYPDGYRIERLRYFWNPALAPLNTNDFKVWMGHTTQTSFPSTGATWIPLTEMTLVFDGTWEITAGAGWKELILQTPFVYNQTDNLIIAMHEFTPGYDTSGQTTQSYFRGTTTAEYRGISYYNDSTNPNPENPASTAPTSRAGYPNTTFVVEPIPTTPVLMLVPDAWDFGTTIINQTQTKQFSISNSGVGTLSVSNITIAGDPSITLTGLPEFPLNLANGESANFTVNYNPTAAGDNSATVTITDNRSTTEVPISGTCVDTRIVSLPYTQNFDSVTTPALPLGWTGYINSTSTSAYVRTTTTYPVSAPNSVYLTNSADASADLRLITPEITLPLNTIKLSFSARSSTAGYPLLVGTVNAIDGTGVFNQIASINLTATHTVYTVSFASYVGTDDYIVFKHGLGGTYRSLYIDDILLEELMANDMAVSAFTGPSMGSVGSATTFNVSVNNNGSVQQNAYTVNLMSVDTRLVLATLNVTDPIAAGATVVHPIQWTPTTQGTYQVYGQVVLANDGNLANNVSANRNITIFPAGNAFVVVGNPDVTTTVNYMPFSFYYKNSVTETIYYEAEMNLYSGSITGVVYKNNFTQAVTAAPVKIWMGTSTLQNLSGGWIPSENYTLVYNGTVDFPLGVNEVVIPLQVPFNYMGGNLIVRANRPMDTVNYASTNNFYYTATAQYPNRSRYLRSDTVEYDPLAPSATGTLVANVPNSTFIVQNAVMIEPVTVSGSVTSNDAPAGLEGAQVRLTGPATHTVLSGPDGSFMIEDVMGSASGAVYTITVSKQGYAAYTAEITVYNSNIVTGAININEMTYPVYNVVAEEVITRLSQVDLTWDPAGPPPSYFADFEFDNGGWVASSNWSNPLGDWEWTNSYNSANFVAIEYPTSCFPASTAYSGAGLWATKLYTNYSNSGGLSYLTQTFDLSGTTNSQLRFWSWNNSNGNYDYGQVRVNGTLLWGPAWQGTTPSWQEIVIDLSAYDGLANVVIQFEHGSSTVVAYAGWYIDDVYVGPATRSSVTTQNHNRELTGYDVYRLLSADEATPLNWTQVGTGLADTEFSDLGWDGVASGDYKWAVIATYSGGLESDPEFSNVLTKIQADVDPVSDLAIATDAGDVVLSWTPVTGATAYKIYAAEDPYAVTWTYIGWTIDSEFVVEAPLPAYKFYKVTAVAGETPPPPTMITPAPAKNRK